MKKVVRLLVEIDSSLMNTLEELMELGDLSTKKELLKTAFALLIWAAREKQKGLSIAAVNETKTRFTELTMPFLQSIERNAAVPMVSTAGTATSIRD